MNSCSCQGTEARKVLGMVSVMCWCLCGPARIVAVVTSRFISWTNGFEPCWMRAYGEVQLIPYPRNLDKGHRVKVSVHAKYKPNIYINDTCMEMWRKVKQQERTFFHSEISRSPAPIHQAASRAIKIRTDPSASGAPSPNYNAFQRGTVLQS